VHDLPLVREVQGVGEPLDDLQQGRDGQQAVGLGVVDQVPAAQQFHGDVRRAVVLARVEDGDDVRVAQAARRLGLAEELCARLLEFPAFELVRQRDRLERNLAVDHRVARPVHDAHRALADLMDDLVAAERGRQR
jgi:hypothetical protein